MSLEELLPQIHSLAHPDKIQLIRILADDLMARESSPSPETASAFPIWAPYDANQAGEALFEALEKDRERH